MSEPNSVESKLRQLASDPRPISRPDYSAIVVRSTDLRRRKVRRLRVVVSVVALGAAVSAAALADPFAPRSVQTATEAPDSEGAPSISSEPASHGTSSTLAPATVDPAQELQDANDLLDAQILDGWVPASPRAAIPGATVPVELWLPVGDIEFVAAAKLTELLPGAQALYDAPRGNVIGYMLPRTGYLSAEDLDDLDSPEERVLIWGCDPLDPDYGAATACSASIHDG